MREVKPVSFRINEEDQEKFKKYATEGGFSQAEAFQNIISLLELENAKNTLGDRAKGIDAFKETANKLINFYLNALEENVTTEDRIREELSKQIKVKDDAIITLRENLEDAKETNTHLINDLNKCSDENLNLQKMLGKTNSQLDDRETQLQLVNENNIMLQEQLKEYKSYKEENRELEKQIQELKNSLLSKQKDFDDAINKNKQYEDKIKNDAEILDFYKNSNIEFKDSLKQLEEKYSNDMKNIKEEHNNNISIIKKEYNNSIESIKKENKLSLEKELETLESNLNNKFEVELSKKDLIIEKLNIKIEQLEKSNISNTEIK